ncbi:FAD-dependent oxidoreductase [Dehalobacter sp. DCM]|uniref:FAD-dependent oxidoreductase n=1 Tax=Dehalobacter sp. DCM TaxID=2907827 RepID=UPI003081BB2E|nr:FAD-dependent oxidoreductase [Dehalobacter sp. DCM]
MSCEKEPKYAFEVPPAPISDDQIKEVINTEIVVIGCGVAGAAATLSAREANAKVVMLEKSPSWNARGRGNFGFNSRLRPALGDDHPNATKEEIAQRRNEVVKEIMAFSGYRGDQRLANLLVDMSGPCADWLCDIATEQGIEIEARKYPKDIGTGIGSSHKQVVYDLLFHPNGEKTVVEMMVNKIKMLGGVDMRFETPAVQLLRKGQGRVTGVIAKDKEGNYLQFNASKGVILCSGGYEWDPEMMEKYAGLAVYAASISYENHCNTGDGQKMGMWIGALMDEAPNCVLYEDGGGYHLENPLHYGVGVARQPWLGINIFGERTNNEDIVWPLIGISDIMKPGHMKYSVWDEKWRDDAKVEVMGNAHSIYSDFHGTTKEVTEEKIRSGAILSANTLEELARKMQVPYETFKVTVDRYNQCCADGIDYDFGKPKYYLKPIDKPPYYAAKMGAAILVTLGGLKINTKMEVLDSEYKPITGFYAAGNASGNFFFNDYPENIPGLSHTRGFTFGYLAAKNAAATQPE